MVILITLHLLSLILIILLILHHSLILYLGPAGSTLDHVISIEYLIALRNHTRQIINVNYKRTKVPRSTLGVHQMLLSANQKSLPIQLPPYETSSAAAAVQNGFKKLATKELQKRWLQQWQISAAVESPLTAINSAVAAVQKILESQSALQSGCKVA